MCMGKKIPGTIRRLKRRGRRGAKDMKPTTLEYILGWDRWAGGGWRCPFFHPKTNVFFMILKNVVHRHK